MIYFFHGNQPYISRLAAKQKYARLNEEFPTYEQIRIDAQESTLDEILQVILTPSMFSGGRNVFIADLSKNSASSDLIPAIIEYFQASREDENMNVVIYERHKIPKNTNYFKAMAAIADVSESAKLNKRTFKQWAGKLLQESDMKFSQSALIQMAQYVNYDPERFDNAIKKLKSAAITNLTSQNIDKYIVDSSETTIFELIDAMNTGDSKQAVSAYENMLRTGLAPQFILIMVARNITNLIMIKDLLNKGAQKAEIQKVTKLPPFTLPIMISTANRYPIERLTKLHDKLYSLDYQIKTGQIDPQVGLTLFLCAY